ncbi:type I DNA topoisomerase [Patescibacteria group bacterium]|nr:type I DNA topoisomerase [Patescibacteria group bacterium]
MSKLLIVESPTKAKTIGKFLGRDYIVVSSFGHIRDLPERKTGVDIKNGFTPEYVVPDDKKPKVKALKDAAKKATEIYLATDEDREGEAISWHIAEVLGLDPETAKRITFHEITRPAIENALKNARHIDMRLVDAQQTRRILDRLVGYELSPLLWKKVQRGLSAGRVQSVAVRLVVERERERLAFKSEEYWSVEADFTKDGMLFTGKLTHEGGKKVDKMDIKDEKHAHTLLADIKAHEGTVSEVEEKQATRKPPTPLTTSTLQQEANNRLGMGAKQTMTLAQKLYETGQITYMRTDSLNLSDEFLASTQAFIGKQFGAEYAKGPTHYKTAKKGAQEAHEAIRPTNVSATPESLRGQLDPGMWKLYDLIWRRTVASQLPPAKVQRTAIDITSGSHMLRATGSVVMFDGFLRVWHGGEDKLLPKLSAGNQLGKPKDARADQHFTEPPPRYSDATLVKAMEEFGIGRPSTYAPTIATVEARKYVIRDDNKRLFPSDTALIVTDLLKEHFPNIVDYDFTATMEKKLDEIAEGSHDWRIVLATFYGPFHEQIIEKTGELSRGTVMKERLVGNDPETNLPITARMGPFGPFVQLGEAKTKEDKPRRASLRDGQTIDGLTVADALKLLSLPRTLGVYHDGNEIVANTGRFGPYLKCGAMNISLPKDVDPAEVSLEHAITLCDEGIARKKKMMEPLATLGKNKDGAEIFVRDGRYGPYVTDGEINATIPKKTDPLSVSLADALELIEKKKKAPKRAWGKKRGAKKDE